MLTCSKTNSYLRIQKPKNRRFSRKNIKEEKKKKQSIMFSKHNDWQQWLRNIESYQHTMTDKIQLIYHISLFHYHFTWEKKLLMESNNLQEQSNFINSCKAKISMQQSKSSLKMSAQQHLWFLPTLLPPITISSQRILKWPF